MVYVAAELKRPLSEHTKMLCRRYAVLSIMLSFCRILLSTISSRVSKAVLGSDAAAPTDGCKADTLICHQFGKNKEKWR